MNSLRKLNEKEKNYSNIINVYKGHHLMTNKKEIENKINKKISFNDKRRASTIPEYTPDMGSLSENDVIY